MIGGALAVDQPVFGHLLEALLERDLLLALQSECLGDLALARGAIVALDELDDLGL